MSAELRAAADQLDMLRDQCLNIYAKQTGLSTEDLTAMLDAETWFTAEQALEQKFCTRIDAASTATACNIELFGFRKAPESPRISATAMLGKPKAAPNPAAQPKGRPVMTTVVDKPAGDHKPADTITATDAQARADAASAAAVTAERTRVTAIRALGRKHKMTDEFIDELTGAPTTVEAAQAKILDKLAEGGDAQQIGNTPIRITADAAEKWRSGATAWLLTRAGVAGIVAKAAAFDPKTAKRLGLDMSLDPGEFRGVSCVDLARESLMHAGVRLASRDPKAIVGAAFTARGEGGMQTTGDFTVLLENTLHKTLQAAYLVTPDTWSVFCGVGTITDFRPHNRYLRGSFSALDDLSEAGEFRNKALPDGSKESITGKTKGNIVALSRQAIINDDMGVFSTVAVDLGRAAKLTIEKDVYTLLALNGGLGPLMGDGKTLFHADHGNLAPTGTAPGVASFDAARQAMASQMDVSGNEFLDIRPDSWLGPLSLGGLVRVLIGSPYDPDATSKLQRPNMVAGLIDADDIVDTPRMTGTAWNMFADKDVAPAIEVAFLNGIQEPFLDSELGWRVDGTEWKVRLDYATGAINWRSAYRNPGAAPS